MSPAPNDPPTVPFPSFDQLLLSGWAVNAVVGRYCVAFRGPDEVVLVWRDGEWRQVAGRGAFREAA